MILDQTERDCLDRSEKNIFSTFFKDYRNIKESIELENKAVCAASHLVNQIRFSEIKEYNNIAEQYFHILHLISPRDTIDSKSCLPVKNENYDSTLYIIHKESKSKKSLQESLNQAKDLLEETGYLSTIEDLEKCIIVSLDEQKFPNTNQSYTIENIHKTIFMDIYEHPILTAESIVHELAHMRFNEIVRSRKITFDINKKYFSPWKEEGRPLFNFLHSAIAFSAVINFLRCLAPKDKAGEKYLSMKIPFEENNFASIKSDVNRAIIDIPDNYIKDIIVRCMPTDIN